MKKKEKTENDLKIRRRKKTKQIDEKKTWKYDKNIAKNKNKEKDKTKWKKKRNKNK